MNDEDNEISINCPVTINCNVDTTANFGTLIQDAIEEASEQIKEDIDKKIRFIMTLNLSSEEEQIEMIRNDYEVYFHITNPSTKVTEEYERLKQYEEL